MQEKCWYKNVCNLTDQCENCIRFMKMNYLFENSLLSEHQRFPVKLKPDEDGTDIKEFSELLNIKNNILEFVNENRNLLIWSKITGNGKTQWSIKLLLAFFDKIWHNTDFRCRGLFINIPRFFNELKENISEHSEYIEHIKKYILEADLIVWDELGVKSLTQYEHDYFLSYINSRLDRGKANIFTSNMTADELKKNLGDRVYSRVVLNSKSIELKGKDKRSNNSIW